MTSRKFLEIRDEGTCIGVMAFRPNADNEAQRAFLAHAGYGKTSSDHASYVIMLDLHSWEGGYDPYKQRSLTRRDAHLFIRDHFDELTDGDVIDVEFIRGDKPTKKTSEILEYYAEV